MTQPTRLEKTLGQPLSQFALLPPDQRSSVVKSAFPDLHAFFDPAPPGERDAPERSRSLARSLHEALSGAVEPAAEAGGKRVPEGLAARIITDALLRAEADRDQNVYLGRLFTRQLTNAVPDVIFQPANAAEAAASLRWARDQKVPVTLRGAASTAMGGSVPEDGGLTLDLSRLDSIEIDAADQVVVVGAGARLRTIHQRLAERGLALCAYPSNLGGTLGGWFLTGGIGLNAYGRGMALGAVRAADLLLPAGEHLRFHDDGRLDVTDERGHRRTLPKEESASWFRERGYEPMTLDDLAGSEGIYGILLHLIVRVEHRPSFGAFLLSFEQTDQALEAAEWIDRVAGETFGLPTNLKFLSASHLHHTRRVWQDEDGRDWHARPSNLSSPAGLPWARIVGPAELGADCDPDREHAGGYLFVDFTDLDAARRFALAVKVACPGKPIVLDRESRRFAAERFRPQQTKRLGPGLIAAEILMPSREVRRFLPRAERLTMNAGNHLDAEICTCRRPRARHRRLPHRSPARIFRGRPDDRAGAARSRDGRVPRPALRPRALAVGVPRAEVRPRCGRPHPIAQARDGRRHAGQSRRADRAPAQGSARGTALRHLRSRRAPGAHRLRRARTLVDRRLRALAAGNVPRPGARARRAGRDRCQVPRRSAHGAVALARRGHAGIG
jgi:FAD/FMN-containing dehydrogenase